MVTHRQLGNQTRLYLPMIESKNNNDDQKHANDTKLLQSNFHVYDVTLFLIYNYWGRFH